MRKNRIVFNIFNILPIFLLSFMLVSVVASVTTLKAKAELVVPDDYEYVDTWDDSYLLNNLKGEQTIEAEGTPTGTLSKGNGGSDCSSAIASSAGICCFAALTGLFLVKKRINK